MVWPRSPLAHDPAINVRHSNRASGRHATAAGGDPPGAVSFSTARRGGGAVLDGRPGQVVAAAPASRGSRSTTPPGNLRATVRCLPRRQLQGHPPFAQSGCAGALGISTPAVASPGRGRGSPGRLRPRAPIDWGDLAGGAGCFDQAHLGHEVRASTGFTPTRMSESGGGSCANTPATRWTAGRCRPIDFLQERQLTTR